MDPWATIAHLSRQDIEDLQNRKLNRFVNQYLYPFSPHYQTLFDQNKIDPKSIKTTDDLRRIPFSSKLDFVPTPDNQDKARGFVLQPDKEKIKKFWPPSKTLPLAVASALKGSGYVQDQLGREFRPTFITFTTGTTNKPVPFLYSRYDIENLNISGSRMLRLFNDDPAARIVNMFPFAPHLAFWQVAFGGLASCVLTLNTGGGRVLGTEGNIAAIMRMKPSIVLGVPSYIYHVLREAKEKGLNFEFIKTIVLGASSVTPLFKTKCAELLASLGANRVAILGTYGFTESRCAWAECWTPPDISSGYHLYPDKEIFEIIDPKTGDVKKDGEDGEIVYTSIDARASAVIRYRTGDFVKGGIKYGLCPHCQRHVLSLSTDISRLSDVKDLQLSKIKGSLVNLNNFGVAISEVPEIDEWQLIIRKKNNDPFEIDEVVVYCSTRDGCDQKSVRDRVREKILGYTEVAPNDVCFVSMPEMVKRLEIETANKEKRVLDERPK